ncbi:glycosyltransferase [Flagellimonas marinaquae]|uniref:glycosyltransferase n=1 Tax=Flagellimonas aurea TaxID=2915619 RepID=UPI001CE230AD|nr:glycosyltransferase [Allomuricauda aquimarina]
MKILHIANSLQTGGAEKLLIESIPRLNDKEHLNVDLLLLSADDEPFLKVLRSKQSGQIFSLSKKQIYNPFFIFKIRPFLKKYDIVHVHLFPSLYWAGFAKLFSTSKVKMVYTEHNTTNRRREITLFKYLDRFVYSMFDKIITISPDVDKNIKSHLGAKSDDDKFLKIPNGVDISAINEAQPINKADISPLFNNDSTILLQVSSFTAQKDQKTVIKALHNLPKNVIACFAGDGPLKKECEVYAKELGLSDRVVFLGIRTDVVRLLKSVDYVLLSSYFEGLSLASIEGMASGKPFIATNVPGLGDIVEGAGILFPVNNSEILSQIVKELMLDKSLCAKVIESCKARAAEYDITLMINKINTLYSNLI